MLCTCRYRAEGRAEARKRRVQQIQSQKHVLGSCWSAVEDEVSGTAFRRSALHAGVAREGQCKMSHQGMCMSCFSYLSASWDVQAALHLDL